VFPADALPWVDVLFGELPSLEADLQELVDRAGPEFFAAALDSLAVTGPDLPALARELKQRTGRKGAGLFMPLRIALTGRRDGPELGPLLAALPQATIHRRFSALAAPQGKH
jgi:glutamyl-tRNA synthetase